jgi:hypothetical protein
LCGVAQQEPEGIAVPLVWVGVEETPILFCNQMVSQFDQDLETFLITFGQVSPPALMGTPEQMREQVEQIAYLPVRAVARISVSRPRMAELHAVLGANLDNLEQARKIQPGDPR